MLRAWGLGSPRLAVIHGRRRLGKTALVRRWLQDRRGHYVQATEGTPASQRAALAADLESILPGFGDVLYPTWRTLFDAMQRRWPDEVPVLVLDEFPYLAESSPELPSILQSMLDSPGRLRPALVLCGSSQMMMQGLVLDATAPLYGRAQLLLRTQPLPVTELQAALRLPTAIATIETWATFGGVPRYWELMRDGGFTSATEALDALVLSPHGVLHEEAERVLRDEEAAALERAACEVIGRGARRPSELAARLGVKETTLSKPLRHLAELGLVDRQAPYDLRTGRSVEGGRRALYRLADPFLGTWYACVRPHLSGLNLRAPTARLRALTSWSQHVAAVWEDVCRERWHRLRHQGIDWEPAGRYWAGREPGGEEWDVVSVSADRKHVFLGECKWMRDATRAKLAALALELRRRSLTPPAGASPGAKIQLGLFVPGGRKLPDVVDDVAVLEASKLLTSEI